MMNAEQAVWLVMKVTLLLLAAFSLDGVWRGRSALTAASLWNAVLLAMLILPLATLLLPQLELRVLPSAPSNMRATVASNGSQSTASADGQPRSADRLVATAENVGLPAGASQTFELSPAMQSDPAWAATSSRSILQVIVCLYLAGALCVVVRLISSWRAVDRLLAGSAPVNNERWLSRSDHWQSKLGAIRSSRTDASVIPIDPALSTSGHRAARLLQSSEIGVPIALGVWRKSIVIPALLASDASRATVDAVLVHELAHLERDDCAWQWLQRIVEVAWWFHPLVWLARRPIAFVRERACDDFTIHALGDVEGYADSLLTVAAAPAARRSLGLGLTIVRRSSLARRLVAMQGTAGSERLRASRVVAGSCMLGTLGATLLLASVAVDRVSAREKAGEATSGAATASATATKPSDRDSDNSATAAGTQPDQQAGAVQPDSLQNSFERIEKARQAIAGYDVRLKLNLTISMKTVAVDIKDPEHPNVTKAMEWRPLEPSEKPITRESSYRQVWSRDGRRRIENERDSANQSAVIVDDGKVVRILVDGKSGSIRLSHEYRLPEPEEYRDYLGDMTGVMQLTKIARERPNTRLIEGEKPDGDLVGIVLPADDGPSFKQLEFRVWLDRRHGFAPSKIETHRRIMGETVLASRMLVDKFHEAQPGVWVPVEMTRTGYATQAGEYRGQAVNVYRATIEVDRSRWNEELSGELFRLPFPAGIVVTDFINSVQITIGEGDDGLDNQALIQRASKTMRVGTPASMRRDQADLAKVREQDREPGKALAKYGAHLKANQEGAITSVGFLIIHRERIGFGDPNIDDAGLRYVCKLSKLEHLSLNDTQITDAGLAQLRDLANLKILSLTNTNITDEGVKQLSSLSNLEWLFLDNNRVQDGKRIRYLKITDEALRHLEPLHKLTHLQLYGTGVTDAGLEHLKVLASLKQVSLQGSDVTPEGARKLRAARPGLLVLLD
jgi:beta-lactamase regulating signal transducer with metallopeptidase domain